MVVGRSSLSALSPAMAVACSFLFVAVLALVTMLVDPYQMDFVTYWAAARLGLGGNPAGAYDFALHRAVELGAVGARRRPALRLTRLSSCCCWRRSGFSPIRSPPPAGSLPPSRFMRRGAALGARLPRGSLWPSRRCWSTRSPARAASSPPPCSSAALALLPKRPLAAGLLLGLPGRQAAARPGPAVRPARRARVARDRRARPRRRSGCSSPA